MMKKYFLGLAVAFLLPALANAQGFEACGTVHDTETFELMKTRALANRQVMDEMSAELRDDDVVYIPVKYHLIGKSDGTQFPKVSNILGLHCKLNEEYAEHDIQFYINDGFNYIQNNVAYENPTDSPTTLNFQRVSNAVNIWIGKNANPQGSSGIGVTLGFYSPSDDWIVLKKTEATYSANTLAHEMGHFLSLNHPFLGWDCTYWEEWLEDNPNAECAPNNAPCFNNPVERQNGSNCATAGDFLCDTPPDYNLGFQAPNCSYNGTACDPTGTQVEPMAENIMGYFDSCSDFIFTDDQESMMLADYNSNFRNYLRTDGGPTNDQEITVTPVLVAPAAEANLGYYNSVALDWQSVPNAEKYVVQTALNSAFSLFSVETVVTTSGLLVDYLDPNTTYFWRVKAFNEYSTCGDWSETRQVNTGGGTTSVQTIEGVSNWAISPNPTTTNSAFNISLDTQKPFTADIIITSVDGKVAKAISNKVFNSGQNTVQVPTGSLSAGLYFVTLRSANSVLNKRLIIAE